MRSYNYFCSTQIQMGMGMAKQLPEMLQSLEIGTSILIVSDPWCGTSRTSCTN